MLRESQHPLDPRYHLLDARVPVVLGRRGGGFDHHVAGLHVDDDERRGVRGGRQVEARGHLPGPFGVLLGLGPPPEVGRGGGRRPTAPQPAAGRAGVGLAGGGGGLLLLSEPPPHPKSSNSKAIAVSCLCIATTS